MTPGKVALLVAAALAVVLVLVKATGVGQRGGRSPRTATVEPAQEARAAEERLLRDQAFYRPVNVAAPSVEVVGPDGRPGDLSRWRGKVVFVNFWATWCPPCVEEMPSMLQLGNALSAAYPDQFQMVAIANDESWDIVERFFTSHFQGVPKSLAVVRDPDAAAARAFYCAARGYCPDVRYPETYIVDRSGRIVAMMVGPRDWTHPEARRLLDSLIRG